MGATEQPRGRKSRASVLESLPMRIYFKHLSKPRDPRKNRSISCAERRREEEAKGGARYLGGATGRRNPPHTRPPSPSS